MSAIALPELVHWPSKTKNKGRTTIIPSSADAVAIGRNYCLTIKEQLADYAKTGVKKVDVVTTFRDKGKTRKKTLNLQTYSDKWDEAFEQYETAAKEIVHGNDDIKHAISELAPKLMALALELTPQIASAYCGFERWEDGEDVLIDLLREGDDRPFLRRKRGDVEPRAGKGDGAYRVIINTDVAWWGKPEMNAAVMGAMVLVLQQFAPVEIWIQQGWLGTDEDDGVSLFKLDFNGSFDPTQLSFWTGSPYKDSPFSSFVNRSLGRTSTCTATHAELPCDLYLRGDWMTLHGIKDQFAKASPQQQNNLAAAWIAATCQGILFGDEAEEQQ